MMKPLTLLFSAWMFFGVAFGTTPAGGQTNPSSIIFRIGALDRSSAGFAGGTPKQPVIFVAGKSNPAKDWFTTQPARLLSVPTKVADPATAARTITFSSQPPHAAMYRLHIALLIESASVPALRIGINGSHGLFYLQPKLDYSNGDQVDSFYAAYSHADVVFYFPGSYLRSGNNTITLQAIEETDKAVRGAALTYDSIELDRIENRAIRPEQSSAQIVPTIFYRREKDQLNEIVDVILTYGKRMKPSGSVDLIIHGKHYRRLLRGDEDFGQQKLSFSVPEFPVHTEAELQWDVARHVHRVKQSIDPWKKWTLFLVPHIHLDVGYSDYQAKVAAIQSRVIDEAMDLTTQHPDFRFSLDGEWSLEQFMKTRTPAEQRRAIMAIQRQELFVPAQYANLLTGFPTAETLIRSLYGTAKFSRLHGTPFNYANITDVPSYSWSYASILSAAGIHYLFSGSDNYRAPVLLQGRLNENSPFWWEGPDGQKVLFWYSRHYMQMQFMFGLPPLLEAGHETLPLFLQMYEHPGYRADATILFGTQVENTDLFPQQAELAQKWNSTYAYPRLQYSGFYDALKNISQQFGDAIPTVSGDGGPYWEDGIASDAYYEAMERENESRGPSAEKLATLTSLVDPRLKADTVNLDRMWTDMVLMDEHTWDSNNSITDPTSEEAVQQLALKNLHAVKAQALADFLARNSMASVSNSISAGPGSLVVFNTLNWSRSGLVAVDLNKGDEIVDATTGQVVPVEILSSGNNFRHVRFVAENVPPVGYKVFQLRRAKDSIVPIAITQTPFLESPYYRVQLDPATGAVLSIYDKQLRKELVNQKSPYRFGQYLYVTGGDASPNRLLLYSHANPKPEIQVYPANHGRLISIERTPYGSVARLKSTDTNTPEIATEIQLFDHEKKIEIVEDVSKKEVDSKEAVYFAFPFVMNQPQFQYEIQTGVVDPARNMYPGAGHEWFSVQHWVSIQEDGLSATVMPLDASLVMLGDINRGEWPAEFGKRTGTIFSYVMNNYWFTNYRAGQGGHFRFRYVITSASETQPAELSRMGWEEMTPLERNEVTAQDKATNAARSLNGKEDSFLDVKDPNLVLMAWKPAEDGRGTILRFLDLGGTTRSITVHTPLLQLHQAWQSDAVERDQNALQLAGTNGFAFTVHPHEIITVRIIGVGVMHPPTL